MAFDGQDGRTGHIRAVVTGTSITWSSWNVFERARPPGRCLVATPSASRAESSSTPAARSCSRKWIRMRGSPTTPIPAARGRAVLGASRHRRIDGAPEQRARVCAAREQRDARGVRQRPGHRPNLTNLRYERSNANGVWSGIVVGSQAGTGRCSRPTRRSTRTTGDWCQSARPRSSFPPGQTEAA